MFNAYLLQLKENVFFRTFFYDGKIFDLYMGNIFNMKLSSVVWQIVCSGFGKMFNAYLFKLKEDVYFRTISYVGKLFDLYIGKMFIMKLMKVSDHTVMIGIFLPNSK